MVVSFLRYTPEPVVAVFSLGPVPIKKSGIQILGELAADRFAQAEVSKYLVLICELVEVEYELPDNDQPARYIEVTYEPELQVDARLSLVANVKSD